MRTAILLGVFLTLLGCSSPPITEPGNSGNADTGFPPEEEPEACAWVCGWYFGREDSLEVKLSRDSVFSILALPGYPATGMFGWQCAASDTLPGDPNNRTFPTGRCSYDGRYLEDTAFINPDAPTGELEFSGTIILNPHDTTKLSLEVLGFREITYLGNTHKVIDLRRTVNGADITYRLEEAVYLTPPTGYLGCQLRGEWCQNGLYGP